MFHLLTTLGTLNPSHSVGIDIHALVAFFGTKLGILVGKFIVVGLCFVLVRKFFSALVTYYGIALPPSEAEQKKLARREARASAAREHQREARLARAIARRDANYAGMKEYESAHFDF